MSDRSSEIPGNNKTAFQKGGPEEISNNGTLVMVIVYHPPPESNEEKTIETYEIKGNLRKRRNSDHNYRRKSLLKNKIPLDEEHRITGDVGSSKAKKVKFDEEAERKEASSRKTSRKRRVFNSPAKKLNRSLKSEELEDIFDNEEEEEWNSGEAESSRRMRTRSIYRASLTSNEIKSGSVKKINETARKSLDSIKK